MGHITVVITFCPIFSLVFVAFAILALLFLCIWSIIFNDLFTKPKIKVPHICYNFFWKWINSILLFAQFENKEKSIWENKLRCYAYTSKQLNIRTLLLQGVYPIIFVSNIFPNSHLIQKCIHNRQLFQNSCWNCKHFLIKWELGKILDTRKIGWTPFNCTIFLWKNCLRICFERILSTAFCNPH